MPFLLVLSGGGSYGVHTESFDFYIKRCFLVMAVDLGKGTL